MGGGSRTRADDGAFMISNSNVFAALDTLRKKKKPDQSKTKPSSKTKEKDPEKPVFWAPAPLQSISWADVDDDDDYFATTAPPMALWVGDTEDGKGTSAMIEEEIESEDEEIDDEPDPEHEIPQPVEHYVKKPTIPPRVAPKEPEKQLSKKELKKRELEELEAVLAEFGVVENDKATNGAQGSHGSISSHLQQEAAGKENGHASGEGKTSKRKKKKERTSKDAAVVVKDQANGHETTRGEPVDEETPVVDIKERLKKKTPAKKKKSNKELDVAGKAAATEAAARSAKLAAAKKKEKNHYNQQPQR